MNPNSAYARYVLNLLNSNDISELAHTWLAEGVFTESLNEICFITSPQMSEVELLLKEAFGEMGASKPSRIEAAKYLVRETLEKIASGSTEPIEGASFLYWKVHHEICEEYPDVEYLGDNLGLAKIFAWLREVWDCRDGSLILYYTYLPRCEAELKFIEHIVEEAESFVRRTIYQ